MREFKFIRGKYTNENIFNSDETSNCLLAYDSDGKSVSFDERNDEEFQNKFAGLSSDRLSEIYTLRPSQFNISAQKESAGHYSFNFKANEYVYDGSRQFPTDVIKDAETTIKSHTAAVFNTESEQPLLNLNGDAERKTLTTFTFNNEKTFTRNLVFKITGTVKEIGYATAQGEEITAYPIVDGIIDFGGTTGTNAKSGTFNQGILQTAATTKTGTIYGDTVNVSAIGNLALAKNYVADEDYRFIKDGKFETDIPYQDDLSFNLYSEVDGYLTAVEGSVATTLIKTFNDANAEVSISYTIKTGYAVYDKDENLSKLLDESQNNVYKRVPSKEVNSDSISSLNNYKFFYINSGKAYMFKGSCNVGARANNQFVEGYAASYAKYFIFKNNKLSNISGEDLSGKETITYYESKDHHIIGSGVYDDNNDGKNYVMFSNEWKQTAINSTNASVRDSDNIISPIITSNVLRLLNDDIAVNATQSD